MRRSRGEGSVYQRKDGLWVARYEAAGKRKTSTGRLNGRGRTARRWLRTRTPTARRATMPGGSAGAHPTGFSALFACPFCHDTTLQWDCLPSVTESVTRRGSQQKCLPTPAIYEDVVSPL